MSNIDHLKSELEMFEMMIPGFVGSLVRSAKQIPPDRWNWSLSDRTPTPREICEHAYLWLWCDRQQIELRDVSQHQAMPKLPAESHAMIGRLEKEADEWRRLIRSLKQDQLTEERIAFDEPRNLRGFLFHIGQHLIHKGGQLSVLFYELGLDGPEPYSASHPDAIYGFADRGPWPAPRA